MSEQQTHEQETLVSETLAQPIESLNPDELQKDPTFEKVRGANWLAKGLVIIFGIVTLCWLVGGLVIIAFYPPILSMQSNKDNIVVEAVVPLIQGVATFASTVFGPLLAFVLGYYFGEQKHEG